VSGFVPGRSSEPKNSSIDLDRFAALEPAIRQHLDVDLLTGRDTQMPQNVFAQGDLALAGHGQCGAHSALHSGA
jgi:hypothetical protein